MNKYPLGRDILVSWSLDLGNQSVNLADCNILLEYSTGAGSKVIPASEYTIDGNDIIWTFPGEQQIAYGMYTMRVLVTSDGAEILNSRKDAFEIIHGTPSEEPQRTDMASSVETTQEQASEPADEEEEDETDYVSRSPLYVEKVPLGSNLVVNWKLLSAAEFDFPLDECELELFYSAAGSGCKRAEDYQLLTEGGYHIQWNFAGDKQVRYGMYSLILDIYYQGARVATLVREDGFDLVHRKASDILTDRIIDFESVVTTFGGGALYMMADIINNGYSTVFRADGTTPAANGDVLQYNGEKWFATSVGDIAAIRTLGNGLSGLIEDVSGIHGTLRDLDGNITDLSLTARGLDMKISNANGDIHDLQVDAQTLYSQISDAEGNISTLQQTSRALTSQLSDAEGNISVLQQTARDLTSSISDAEGNISVLQQTAISLTSSIEDAEGNISVLQQTASGLQYQVSNQAGDIATLQVSARGLQSTVSTLDGKVSTIEQTAERIGLQVQGVDDELARYETITDSTIEDMQRQIDGAIETWFYMGAPTLLNQPAVNWTTVAEKNNHLGDLYYDKLTGYAYRFMVDETVTPAVYSWGRITDVDVTKALADAAHAQATADGKLKMFLVQPTPPYHLGDLWVKSDGTIFKCVVEKPNDDDVYSASDWSSSDFASKMVVKANFDVLANAIIGTVAGYDADGKITSATATQFEQSIDRISFSVAKVGSALLPTGINIADEIITIRSNNFVLAGNGVGDPAALTITYRNNVPYISASNLDITGILATNEWTAEEAILNGYADNAAGVAQLAAENYADGVSGTAETNAKNYAYNYSNSTEYLNGVIQVLINTSISGKADDANYAYLRTALENRTSVLGGLLLTTLIQLGATESVGGWSVHSGISGEYIETSDPTDPEYHIGHGIAAWYGGPMVDLAEHLTDDPVPAHAKTVFRMDGSGYLADRAIYWGDQGDLHLNTNIVLGDTTPGNPTINSILTFMAKFGSWFVEDTTTMTGKTLLRINMGSQQGTGFDGLIFDGFLITGGDQVIRSGGGGGGGGGSATYLYELKDTLSSWSSKPSADSMLVFDSSATDKNSGTGAWKAVANTLSNIGDVTLTNVSNGQMLAWNGSAWVNVAAPTGTITSVALESGTNNGTLKLTVNGTPTDNIAVTGWSSKADASSLSWYVARSGDSMSGALKITATGSADYSGLVVGGSAVNINPVIADQTSMIQIVAGTGGATNSSAIGFHNPQYSSAILEYRNTAQSVGYFNFRADNNTWDVRVNGNVVLHAGNFVAGTNYVAPATLSDYLPLSAGSSSPLTGVLYGNTGNGLEVRSSNTGPWKEGIRIYHASNGYAVMALTDTSAQNLIAIVHNPDITYPAYFDYCKNGTNKSIYIPYESGTMALTSSNVASATQLQTSRTIWGQSFNGTGNVDGMLTQNVASANAAIGIGQIISGSATGTWAFDVTQGLLGHGNVLVVLHAGVENSTNNKMNLIFRYTSSGSTTNRVCFGFYGNDNILNYTAQKRVGVNTDSPGSALHISSTENEVLRIDTSNSEGPFNTIRHNGNTKTHFGYYPAGGYTYFGDYASSCELRLFDNGALVWCTNYASQDAAYNKTIWHSGNSNTASVAWTASQMYSADSFWALSGAVGAYYSGNGIHVHNASNGWTGNLLLFDNTNYYVGVDCTPGYKLDVNGILRTRDEIRIEHTTPQLVFSPNAGYYSLINMGNGGVMFQNGASRTADGGAKTFTIRNDDGELRLGGSTTTTRLVGSTIQADSRINITYTGGFSTPPLGLNFYSGYTVSDTSIAQMKMGDPVHDCYLGLAPTTRTHFGKVGYFFHIDENYGEFMFASTNWKILMAIDCATSVMWVNGTIQSTGDQVISSDLNKKTNFQDINLSVEQIANAPAVTFDWKAGGHSFGSIAQYWKPLLGEMVLGEEGDYTLAYAQGALVTSIINARAIVALQDHETEQDKEIRELKERVQRLESENQMLRERLN